MKLSSEIIKSILEKEEINITFPNIKINLNELVETECYNALRKIKSIIEDDNLTDFECVEKIICVFEKIGIAGGNRHDFG